MNPSSPGSQRWLRRGLGALGILAVSYTLVRLGVDPGVPIVALVAMILAVAAWFVLLLTTRSTAWAIPLFVIMIAGGALAATSTNGLGIAAAAVGVLWMTRDPEIPFSTAVWFTVGALLVTPLGLLLSPQEPIGLLSMEAGVIVAFLGGQGRRQGVRAEAQARELLQNQVEMREEQARAEVLASRQQIAHDIHDVLAHSLGGLVIQLDAVDALLESGDTAAARRRVRDARELAADGLGDARRAVTALREAPTDDAVPARAVVDASVLIVAIDSLLDAHRALGGTARFTETGARRSIGEPLEVALRRALQEALTNARRHAPGEVVSVTLDWTGHSVALAVENGLPSLPVSGGSPSTGGGHGLVGMRERFAQLAGGSATAERVENRFVVTVRGDAS